MSRGLSPCASFPWKFAAQKNRLGKTEAIRSSNSLPLVAQRPQAVQPAKTWLFFVGDLEFDGFGTGPVLGRVILIGHRGRRLGLDRVLRFQAVLEGLDLARLDIADVQGHLTR